MGGRQRAAGGRQAAAHQPCQCRMAFGRWRWTRSRRPRVSGSENASFPRYSSAQPYGDESSLLYPHLNPKLRLRSTCRGGGGWAVGGLRGARRAARRAGDWRRGERAARAAAAGSSGAAGAGRDAPRRSLPEALNGGGGRIGRRRCAPRRRRPCACSTAAHSSASCRRRWGGCARSSSTRRGWRR